MRVHARNSGINVAVRITLTGLYETMNHGIRLGGVKVCSVEASVENATQGHNLARGQHRGDPETFWVQLGDLEDDHGFPLCYADLRRALLWTWLENRTKPIGERGLTHYERQLGSFDAY